MYIHYVLFFFPAHFPKNQIKKVIQSYLGSWIPANASVIVAGCAKLFVGEIVDRGKEKLFIRIIIVVCILLHSNALYSTIL